MKNHNIIAVRLVKKPKKVFYCTNCTKVIEGEHVYMFGSAHGDNPYGVRVHMGCLTGTDWRIKKLLETYTKEYLLFDDLHVNMWMIMKDTICPTRVLRIKKKDKMVCIQISLANGLHSRWIDKMNFNIMGYITLEKRNELDKIKARV